MIARSEQFTSAVVIGELYSGAFRSADSSRHLQNIESPVLPAITVLAYDLPTARVYGSIRARLEVAGKMLRGPAALELLVRPPGARSAVATPSV